MICPAAVLLGRPRGTKSVGGYTMERAVRVRVQVVVLQQECRQRYYREDCLRCTTKVRMIQEANRCTGSFQHACQHPLRPLQLHRPLTRQLHVRVRVRVRVRALCTFLLAELRRRPTFALNTTKRLRWQRQCEHPWQIPPHPISRPIHLQPQPQPQWDRL